MGKKERSYIFNNLRDFERGHDSCSLLHQLGVAVGKVCCVCGPLEVRHSDRRDHHGEVLFNIGEFPGDNVSSVSRAAGLVAGDFYEGRGYRVSQNRGISVSKGEVTYDVHFHESEGQLALRVS
jgi:hypothetical protein